MSQKIYAAITAVGGYVPEDVLTNAMLEAMVDTSDEWIKSRTGISERRILKGEHKGSSDLAIPAVKQILEKSGLDPMDIDCIVCATVSPDMIFPATANIIAHAIGAYNAFGFDLSAACSGFLFALTTGATMVESGRYKNVIVVGADKMSAIVDYTDRNTCILFGDGAGALLLQGSTEPYGLIDSKLCTNGNGRESLFMKSGGSLRPPSQETVLNKEHFVYQDGKTVFKFAVKGMADVSAEVMERNKLTGEDVAWLVPHQANMRIISATADRMGVSMDKVMINIHRYGNTTAATIPLCLWEWENKLKKGDNLILAAFGGGFSWGATYIRWGYNSH